MKYLTSSFFFIATWNLFLAPLNSTSVRIADGASVEVIFDREESQNGPNIAPGEAGKHYDPHAMASFTLAEPSASSSISSTKPPGHEHLAGTTLQHHNQQKEIGKKRISRPSLDFSRPNVPKRGGGGPQSSPAPVSILRKKQTGSIDVASASTGIALAANIPTADATAITATTTGTTNLKSLKRPNSANSTRSRPKASAEGGNSRRTMNRPSSTSATSHRRKSSQLREGAQS